MKSYKRNLQQILFAHVTHIVSTLEKNNQSDGISFSMFKYLDIIYLRKGVSPSELAQLADVSRPAVTKMIKKLLTLKLVEKEYAETGRRYFIIATEKTNEIYEEINRIDHRLVDTMDKHLSLHKMDNIDEMMQKLFDDYCEGI